MKGTIIDKNKWTRKGQYNNFISYTCPVFSVGTRLDVTTLVNYCSENKISFFSTFLYIVMLAINKIDELKTRIVGENIITFNKVNPSYVVLNNDENIVTQLTIFNNNFSCFYKQSREDIITAKRATQKGFNSTDIIDCVYISCLPWLDFTSINNPYNYNNTEQTSIPRVTWGKYVKINNKYEMSIDISLHHSLADGFHVAKFYEYITIMLSDLKTYLEGQ